MLPRSDSSGSTPLPHSPASAPDRVETDLGAVAAVTDRGKRHVDNEDAVALRLLDTFAVLVLSDGVSISDDPDAASRAAVGAGAELLAEQVAAGADPTDATVAAIHAAASAVAALAAPGRVDRAPACTYVSAVITAETVVVGWVGDSRAYWLTAADPRCLTIDDSWALRMVAAGLLDADTAAADPRAHALTGWLGADAGTIDPHVVSLPIDSPGVVLLCSDGLWNYLDHAEDLADAALPAAQRDPIAAARALADLALDAGGRDNITVAVAPVPLHR